MYFFVAMNVSRIFWFIYFMSLVVQCNRVVRAKVVNSSKTVISTIASLIFTWGKGIVEQISSLGLCSSPSSHSNSCVVKYADIIENIRNCKTYDWLRFFMYFWLRFFCLLLLCCFLRLCCFFWCLLGLCCLLRMFFYFVCVIWCSLYLLRLCLLRSCCLLFFVYFVCVILSANKRETCQ